MKNIRRISLMMIAVMALALPLGALAQESAAPARLEGLVTEVVDGGFVMEDIEIGSVMLNVDETTVLDGILAEGEIEAGQYVFVSYDGRLTRSLPPQAHADRVGSYRLEGTVDALLPNGALLTGDPIFGDVIVRVDGSLPHLYEGMPAVVYYDGVMALSLPGQVNARHIVVPELTGIVSEKDSAGFTLTDAEGGTYRVLISEKTPVGMLSALVEDAPDAEPSKEEDAAAQPSEATDAPEDEADQPAATEAPSAPSTVEWGDGDTVTVYYNGITTRSLPPQLTALEVLVIRD